jgi:cell division septal protein FtsQ
MAEPARRQTAAEEAPHYDPRSIERTLLEQRARREARLARKRARRHARIRFFVVILALLGGAIALGTIVWQEIQKLFGL